MRIKQALLLCAPALFLMMNECAVADEKGGPFVRLAELEIDSAHLERFKASAKKQIEAAVRLEPGVLALYAAFVKDNPALIRHIGLTWKCRISIASGRRPTTSLSRAS